MNTHQKDTEIPEELFRKEFGGDRLRREMEERRRDKATGLAASGLLLLILAPLVLAAIAGIIASMMYYGLTFRL